MEPTILLATTNAGKIREIRQVLTGLPVRFRTLGDRPGIAEPEETGRTFAENAELKARYYADRTGLAAVAEDSGLAIDALGGRPGIHSARYPGATYPDKFARLHGELAGHRRPWTAHYVCSLAFAAPAGPAGAREPLLFATEATVDGTIAAEPVGSGGFGYDPIFFYPPYGTTLADVDDARKLAVAHRGVAFRIWRDWLTDQLAQDWPFLTR